MQEKESRYRFDIFYTYTEEIGSPGIKNTYILLTEDEYKKGELKKHLKFIIDSLHISEIWVCYKEKELARKKIK